MVEPADEHVGATAAVEVRPKLPTVDVADLDPVGQAAPVNLADVFDEQLHPRRQSVRLFRAGQHELTVGRCAKVDHVSAPVSVDEDHARGLRISREAVILRTPLEDLDAVEVVAALAGDAPW